MTLRLCEDQPRECQTQFVYTPDPDTVEGPVRCGVCNSLMTEHRGCNGPTGYFMAISGSKRKHDLFICPHRDKVWHKQVVEIRNESRVTSSQTIRNILLDEADDILDEYKATID